jgi:hypothetical protein
MREIRNNLSDIQSVRVRYVSILTMSAECKRVFSSTRKLLTERRAKIKGNIIDAFEYLRQ